MGDDYKTTGNPVRGETITEKLNRLVKLEKQLQTRIKELETKNKHLEAAKDLADHCIVRWKKNDARQELCIKELEAERDKIHVKNARLTSRISSLQEKNKELEAENTRLQAAEKAARELCEAIEHEDSNDKDSWNVPIVYRSAIQKQLTAVRELVGKPERPAND